MKREHPDGFTRVKRRARSIGRSCMHCGRSATVTARRWVCGKSRDVRYCEEHAAIIIDGKA